MAGFLFLGDERALPVRRPTDRAKLGHTEFGALSMILQSLAGLPAFLVYFCTAIVAVVAYLLDLYPHHPAQ